MKIVSRGHFCFGIRTCLCFEVGIRTCYCFYVGITGYSYFMLELEVFRVFMLVRFPICYVDTKVPCVVMLVLEPAIICILAVI
jgi:hypothetical protein